MAKKLPDDALAGDIAHRLQYGEDADNPLLEKLIAARAQLLGCKGLGESKPLLAVLFENAQKQASESVPWWMRMEFHGLICQALLTTDARFFHELARLLETRIGKAERRMDLEVARAFSVLRSEGQRIPTKKEVREAALHQLAFYLVLSRRNSPDGWMDMHDISEDLEVTLKPEVLKEIRQEMEQIPEQNWTRIFKRCGLEHLPNDRGGKGTHRRRKARH